MWQCKHSRFNHISTRKQMTVVDEAWCHCYWRLSKHRSISSHIYSWIELAIIEIWMKWYRLFNSQMEWKHRSPKQTVARFCIQFAIASFLSLYNCLLINHLKRQDTWSIYTIIIIQLLLIMIWICVFDVIVADDSSNIIYTCYFGLVWSIILLWYWHQFSFCIYKYTHSQQKHELLFKRLQMRLFHRFFFSF